MEFHNALVLNSTIVQSANLLTEIDVWRATGFDAMEIHATKLEQYLQSGFSRSELLLALRDVTPEAVAYHADPDGELR